MNVVPRLALFWILGLACLACDGQGSPDAGADAGGTDAGSLDAGSDAGPADAGLVAPSGEMALSWVQLVTSDQRLGGVAEARIAPTPGDGVLLGVTLGGAPATFGPGTAGEVTVGTAEENRATQAAAWLDASGAITAARLVMVADPVLDGFAGIGWGVDTFADGSSVFAGQFTAGARFGGTDPAAVTFATLREMPEMDVTVTSSEAYVARFDPARRVVWARRGQSETGFANFRFVDVVALADGGSVGVGLFDDPITLGDGAGAVRHASSSGATTGEVFVAKHAADGSLVWSRRIAGESEPRRVAAFDDGSFVVLFRYSQQVVVGEGESAERTLDAPPAGVRFWDAIARYDADGALAWVARLGSDATTYPGLSSLRLTADGGVVVGGTFRGELAWPDEPTVMPLMLYGTEGLVARLDASGALAWQHRLRPVRDLAVQALAPSADGGTWAAVTVGGNGAVFSPEGAPALELAPLTDTPDNARLALLRFGAEGTLRAAQLLAWSEVDADDLLLTAGGDLMLVGRFGEGTRLEPGTTAEVALPTAVGFRNLFVARYSPR